MPDRAIDYSDIPPLDAEFFRTARLMMPRPKKPIAMRIDADVLDWLKRQGPNYQSHQRHSARLHGNRAAAADVEANQARGIAAIPIGRMTCSIIHDGYLHIIESLGL